MVGGVKMSDLIMVYKVAFIVVGYVVVVAILANLLVIFEGGN